MADIDTYLEKPWELIANPDGELYRCVEAIQRGEIGDKTPKELLENGLVKTEQTRRKSNSPKAPKI